MVNNWSMQTMGVVNEYLKSFAAGRIEEHRIDVFQSIQCRSPRNVMPFHVEVFNQLESSGIGHPACSS